MSRLELCERSVALLTVVKIPVGQTDHPPSIAALNGRFQERIGRPLVVVALFRQNVKNGTDFISINDLDITYELFLQVRAQKLGSLDEGFMVSLDFLEGLAVMRISLPLSHRR